MPRRKISWEIAGFFLFLTIASVAGLWWEWYHFHWQTIVLAVAMYLLCGFSITVYYHRGITHKSFKMARSLQYVMAILSTGALLLPARKWRMRHEDHHQFTDDPQLDPNCARAGFWGSLDVHIGQVICSRYQDRLIATDLSVDPVELWQAKWYWPMAVSVGFIMPIALASLWDDAIGGFLVASCQRMWLQYNGAFLVNSAAHSALFGTKPLGHWSSATNLSFQGWRLFVSPLFVVLSLGEVLGHLFHHKRQASWDTGWWRVNPTSLLILAFERLGLVWDLREY